MEQERKGLEHYHGQGLGGISQTEGRLGRAYGRMLKDSLGEENFVKGLLKSTGFLFLLPGSMPYRVYRGGAIEEEVNNEKGRDFYPGLLEGKTPFVDFGASFIVESCKFSGAGILSLLLS